MSDHGISELFPGEPLEIPDDDERDRADALIAQWATRFGEHAPGPIARVHPQRVGSGHPRAGSPTNRAYMRSRLRRFWAKP